MPRSWRSRERIRTRASFPMRPLSASPRDRTADSALRLLRSSAMVVTRARPSGSCISVLTLGRRARQKPRSSPRCIVARLSTPAAKGTGLQVCLPVAHLFNQALRSFRPIGSAFSRLEPVGCGTRGTELRRHLLNFLRDHREELGPYRPTRGD